MRTLLRYVRFMARAVRPAIFLHHVITQELGQFALKFGQKFKEVLGDRATASASDSVPLLNLRAS